MKYLSVAFLFAVLCVSCGTTVTKPVDVYTVDIRPQNESITLSDYFALDTIIQIKGEIFAGIDNVIRTPFGYVIQGESKDGELHLVSLDGDYQKSIIKPGRGPGEALNIVDVSYDSQTHCLDILSDYGLNIIVYSLDSNQIVNQYTLPESYVSRAVERLDRDTYVLYKDLPYSDKDEYKISIFDCKNNQIKAQFINLNKQAAEYISFIQRNNLYKRGSDVFFYEAFVDTIYRISSDTLKPYFAYSKNQYKIDESDLYSNYSDTRQFIDFCKKSSSIWAHINCYEYKDLLISQYVYNNVDYINIAQIGSSDSHSGSEITDNIVTDSKCGVIDFRVIGADEDFLYVSFDALKLASSKQSAKYNVDVNGNPCILLLKKVV